MTIYIVDIEGHTSRYTKEWKQYLPQQLKQYTNKEVISISGGEVLQTTTPGAFLNFGGTSAYKGNQLEQIGQLFCQGKIKDNDYFLYTDAWNPTVIQLKYMAELLNVKIKIGGMWHAGSYDPNDFLGRLIGDKPWVRSAEESMYNCFDHNFFASHYHMKIFETAFINTGKAFGAVETGRDSNKLHVVGWPMEYMEQILKPYKNITKKNLILFPHRMAPEKQPDIFTDLKNALPQYDFVFAQEKQLTKNEYHKLLGETKLIFSANLQETLGISWYEGLILDVIPMIPNRLSYKEMATFDFVYPSTWTDTMEHYFTHKDDIIQKINEYMTNHNTYIMKMQHQKEILQQAYFSGTKMYETINNSI